MCANHNRENGTAWETRCNCCALRCRADPERGYIYICTCKPLFARRALRFVSLLHLVGWGTASCSTPYGGARVLLLYSTDVPTCAYLHVQYSALLHTWGRAPHAVACCIQCETPRLLAGKARLSISMAPEPPERERGREGELPRQTDSFTSPPCNPPPHPLRSE